MEIGPPFIAYGQPTEAIQPGQGALHRPARLSQPLARRPPAGDPLRELRRWADFYVIMS